MLEADKAFFREHRKGLLYMGLHANNTHDTLRLRDRTDGVCASVGQGRTPRCPATHAQHVLASASGSPGRPTIATTCAR